MPPQNVIVIVLDTARADIVSDCEVMPSLIDIGDQGTRFTNCFANAPWTFPSHSSIFSGELPSDHGVFGKGNKYDDESDLPSLISRQGYSTAAFSNNPWISPDFGFDNFDEFAACWKPFRRGSDLAGLSQLEGPVDQIKEIIRHLDHNAPFTLANAMYMKFFQNRGDSGSARTTEWIKNWINEVHETGPFFAFVNYMEPHLEYNPPKSFAERFLPDETEYSDAKRVNQDPWSYLVGEVSMTDSDFEILRSLYKAELSYLDDRLDDLLTYLKRRGLFEDTAVLILGDHGENIGDHGLMDHQYSLRDSLLKVPLIIHYPPQFESNTEFRGIVELRDLFPTILKIAGVDSPNIDDVSSKSVQEMLDDGGRDFAISEYPVPQPAIETLRERYDRITTDLTEYDRSIRSIRTETHRYIQYDDGTEELYEISEEADTEELTNPLENDDFELRNIMEKELGPLSDYGGQREGNDISALNREHLEDLGYL